jgi:hypothetical protein
MKIVSVNIGMPWEVKWHKRIATTAIYKGPVGGQISSDRFVVTRS